MTRKLRIAFCRIAQETNALSPVCSELADFHRTHFMEGDELLAACGRFGTEVTGFARSLELSGFVRGAEKIGGDRVELVPLFSAWAVPSGKLSANALAWFRKRLVDDLRAAGPLDGLFLSMHGAMVAIDVQDPEAALLSDARSVLGPLVPISVSYDLHAHLTRAKIDAAPLVTAYRTNPHRDHFRVGYRSAEILVRTLLGSHSPTIAWRTLPMVLGGGTTIDFLPTMRPIFKLMKRMERDPRVLYVSLFTCQLWNDAPDLGWATHVITDDDPGLAERLAEQLADAAWAVRHKLPPQLPGPEEALRQARSAGLLRKFGTVCISDASDMVGAGATGENTALLRTLVDSGQGLLSYAPIRDAQAIDALWDTPLGSAVSLEVGGKLAPDHHAPLEVSGRLLRRYPDTAFGRIVVLDLGHVKLVITENAPLAMKPSFYRNVGLRPHKADICVVKSLFPFRLYFLLHNRKTIYAKTRGTTDFDAYKHIHFDGEVHPRDPVAEWRPADRRRRLHGG